MSAERREVDRKTTVKRNDLLVVAVAAALIASLSWAQPVAAQRFGGVRASNSQAFRAGATVGRHQGYRVGASQGYRVGANQGYRAGVNHGYRHGASVGYHAGYHAGGWAHPWAYRAPVVWPWHPVGYFVATIAATAVVVSIVNSAGQPQSSGNVYYDQGVYYEKTSDGYKAIPAPPGAQLPSLPEGYTSITVGGDQYGYYQGDFYVESNGKYMVTAAPAGAVVPYVPDSATETDQGGTKYYDYAGTRYQAVSVSGETQYLVNGPAPASG